MSVAIAEAPHASFRLANTQALQLVPIESRLNRLGQSVSRTNIETAGSGGEINLRDQFKINLRPHNVDNLTNV